MIELELGTKSGFVYSEQPIEALAEVSGLKFKNLSYKKAGSTSIWSFDLVEYEAPNQQVDLLKITGLSCIHGHKIDFKEINRLPQEGWQELIGCWSCHDGEFKGLLNLKIKPRVGGILVSNFYLIADEGILPECCSARTKLFYNEIRGGLTAEQLIFKFFEEHFAMKSTVVLRLDEKRYEIKLFYRCILIKDKAKEAFKVGFRETERTYDEDAHIGEHFKGLIVNELEANKLEVTALGFILSFITT